MHLLDLFHDVTYQTSHGQLLDTTTAPIGTVRRRWGGAGGGGARVWVCSAVRREVPVLGIGCGAVQLRQVGAVCKGGEDSQPPGSSKVPAVPFLRWLLYRRTAVPHPQVDLTRYTLATYMRIVTYKTAFYTFYLPVACGLRLAGIT